MIMAQLKCTECGHVFEGNLKECPNCGCPAGECEMVSDKNNATDNEASVNKASTIIELSLTACKDCGAKISANAERCPHCGAKGKYASLDYGDAIYDCFCRKYCCFSGRSRRSEVFPFIVLVGMLCGTLIYFKPNGVSDGPRPELLPFLITLLPMLGAIVRRLHDIGRSGWWLLCPFVPEIFIFKDSDKTENEYGKSPKYQPEYNDELPDKGTVIGKWILIALAILLVLAVIIFVYSYSETYYY